MGVGRLQGTPWHSEYLKMREGDKRRDKRRCKHHEADDQCRRAGTKCFGSSHCSHYKEKDITTIPAAESVAKPAKKPETRPVHAQKKPEPPCIDWNKRFPVGSLVRHSKFGYGRVTEVVTDSNKIRVLFDDGKERPIDAKESVDKDWLEWIK